MINVLPLVALKNALNFLIADTPDAENVWVGLIIVSATAYILALIFTKKSSCIVVCGLKDFLLVVVPEVIVVLILLYNSFYGRKNGKIISADNVLANVVFILPVVATLAVSITTNLRRSSMPQAVFSSFFPLLQN